MARAPDGSGGVSLFNVLSQLLAAGLELDAVRTSPQQGTEACVTAALPQDSVEHAGACERQPQHAMRANDEELAFEVGGIAKLLIQAGEAALLVGSCSPTKTVPEA